VARRDGPFASYTGEATGYFTWYTFHMPLKWASNWNVAVGGATQSALDQVINGLAQDRVRYSRSDAGRSDRARVGVAVPWVKEASCASALPECSGLQGRD
jgi:hypothetical protein